MSRFKKLSYVIWFCQYHIVFVAKYRYRILKGDIGKFVYQSIYA
ncbi:MAG: transposase, partial [Methylococcaceae bacterium]